MGDIDGAYHWMALDGRPLSSSSGQRRRRKKLGTAVIGLVCLVGISAVQLQSFPEAALAPRIGSGRIASLHAEDSLRNDVASVGVADTQDEDAEADAWAAELNREVLLIGAPQDEDAEADAWAAELNREVDAKDLLRAVDKELEGSEFQDSLRKGAASAGAAHTQDADAEADAWAAELNREDLIRAINKELEGSEFQEESVLMLNEKNIDDDSISVVIATLRDVWATLRVLTLGNNHITDEGVRGLIPTLEHSKGMEAFYIDHNKLSDEGIKLLAPALSRQERLEVIYLNDNQIGDAGAEALATVLPQFTSLKCLNLQGNQIGDKGAEALARVLANCSSLEVIYLQANRIGRVAVKALQATGKTGTAPFIPFSEQESSEQAYGLLNAVIKEIKFLVDNSDARAPQAGLSYRLSKQLQDKDPEGSPAEWGTHVWGIDMGDGWLEVNKRFLPMKVNGKIVLKRIQPPPPRADRQGVQSRPLDLAAAPARKLSEAAPQEGAPSAAPTEEGGPPGDGDAEKERKKEEKKKKKDEEKKAKEEEKKRREAERLEAQANKGKGPNLTVGELDNHTFGNFFVRSEGKTSRQWTPVALLAPSMNDTQVWLRARAQSVRKQGAKLTFLILRQDLATVQAVVETKEMAAFAAALPEESVVDVLAKVACPAGPIVSCTQSEVELMVEKLFCIGRSSYLPLLVADAGRSEAEYEKDPALVRVGQDVRLDNRVIDLRTVANQAIFRIQSAVCTLYREFLLQHGFQEIHTPKMIATASEGGADVFRVDYFDGNAFLAQSPQLYKQMALMSDMPRVFEIGPVFRSEKSFTHRHMTEFTGLDLEMTFKEHYHEVLDVIDGLFNHIFTGLSSKYRREIEAVRQQFPFEDLKWKYPCLRLTFQEAVVLLRSKGPAILEARVATAESENDRGLIQKHLESVRSHGDLDDIGTADEQLLGEIIRQEHGQDFYIIDKFPKDTRPFYTMPDPHDERFTNGYDLFLRGEEITSGAQRIHDPDMLVDKAKSLGMNASTIQPYVDSFKYGSYPHAGCGIGMERVVMLFLNLNNIRKSSMFPRDPKRLTP